MPRVLVELQPGETIGALLTSSQAVTNLLVIEAHKQGFNGWVRISSSCRHLQTLLPAAFHVVHVIGRAMPTWTVI